MISWGLSDSVAGVSESPAKCRQCGATTRLGNGLCLSCTLREGLEGDREASRESFEAILAEDEVRDTHWRGRQLENLEGIERRARCNTRMNTGFCIAISSLETSCSMVAANHS